MKREELESLGRRELQALAKENSLKANAKSAVIIEQLLEIYSANVKHDEDLVKEDEEMQATDQNILEQPSCQKSLERRTEERQDVSITRANPAGNSNESVNEPRSEPLQADGSDELLDEDDIVDTNADVDERSVETCGNAAKLVNDLIKASAEKSEHDPETTQSRRRSGRLSKNKSLPTEKSLASPKNKSLKQTSTLTTSTIIKSSKKPATKSCATLAAVKPNRSAVKPSKSLTVPTKTQVSKTNKVTNITTQTQAQMSKRGDTKRPASALSTRNIEGNQPATISKEKEQTTKRRRLSNDKADAHDLDMQDTKTKKMVHKAGSTVSGPQRGKTPGRFDRAHAKLFNSQKSIVDKRGARSAVKIKRGPENDLGTCVNAGTTSSSMRGEDPEVMSARKLRVPLSSSGGANVANTPIANKKIGPAVSKTTAKTARKPNVQPRVPPSATKSVSASSAQKSDVKARPKFNLQESLKRPITWKMKTGPLR